MPERDSHIRRDIVTGSAGGTSGAALGLILGGPVGALGGALVGAFTEAAASGLVGWVHSRQGERVFTVAQLVDQLVAARIASGEKPRSDGFLGDDSASLAEAALATAEREFEKKKLPLMASLVASVAFRPDMDAPTAHLCLRMVERLSYRQLCVLAAIGRNLGLELMRHDYDGQKGSEARPAVGWVVDVTSEGAMLELLELGQLGLVRRTDNVPLARWSDIAPASLRLDGVGQTVVGLALLSLDATSVQEMVGPILADKYDSEIE